MPDEAKFWADDFDMDLPKVFPDIRRMLREPQRALWTVGHKTFERLNHPTVWNTHGAFLWLEKPNLSRDENDWFNVLGCVSNELEVECTWLEFLRDAWSHHYETLILPFHRKLPAMKWPAFERIMWNVRGWSDEDTQAARREAIQWIVRCDYILNSVAAVKEKTHA